MNVGDWEVKVASLERKWMIHICIYVGSMKFVEGITKKWTNNNSSLTITFFVSLSLKMHARIHIIIHLCWAPLNSILFQMYDANVGLFMVGEINLAI